MEIKVKPISLEDRMQYIQSISENQQVNTKKLPWGVAITILLISAGVVYIVISSQKKKEKKEE